MTNTKIKKLITKGAMLIAVLFMLVGGIVSHALTAVSMETEESYTPNFSFDYTEMLTAPVKVDTGNGAYYVPTSYVYYGRRYDSANQRYVSLLNRVLDPNADNAGNGGAMFLLAEETGYTSRFSIYTNDDLADMVIDENSYIGSSLQQKKYSGAYTVYEISFVNTASVNSLPQELDYIRKITKADVAADMSGHFGFAEGDSNYYWSVVDTDGNPVNSLNLLEDAKVFPLSADELYKYVGDGVFAANSSAGALFVATDVIEGTPVSWWLRTALVDGANTGEFVGIVDSNGKVTYGLAKDTHAARNAFNIETSDIAFVEHVADKTYRLAFHAPEYKEGDSLEAALTDVRGNTVTFTVKNHIGHSGWEHAGESRISYVVTDSEGNEKYYGTAGKIRTSTLVGERITEDETFTLTLPECYVQGDKVKVFWERTDDPDRICTSYVSNFVDLGCIHTPEGGSEANCRDMAICGVCDLPYGSPDENNHRDVSTVWTYNDGESTHSRSCLYCNAKVYTEPCSFGLHNLEAPNACYDSICNGCSHRVDAPSLHNYGENGVCIASYGEFHYEMPQLTNYLNIGFSVNISTVGEWNALATWLNNGGYFIHLNEYKDVTLTGDLDFNDIPFVPMGTQSLPVKNIDIRGQHKKISNIEYSAIDDEPAGIIAIGENISVENIILSNSSFSGSDVGCVVGRLSDETADSSNFKGIAVNDVNLYGNAAGGIVGTLTAEASLSFSFIYNVQHNNAPVDFSSDGKLIPTPASDNEGVPYSGCYRLADEGDGEFAFDSDAFASGEITYRLRQVDPNWKQTLGTGGNRYPVYCKDESVKRVYRVISCDGIDVFYSNENLGHIQHGEYTSVDPSTFEWVDGVGVFGIGFKVKAVCGRCEVPTDVILESDSIEYYSHNRTFIARTEYNAYIEIGGDRIKVNEEPKVIYRRLEDLIGLTPITVKYNGNNNYADILFENIRDGLEYIRDFKAYFLDPVTGERLTEIEYDYYGKPVENPTGVKNVGTYDVLIVGNGGFEGYEYLYEDVYTIEKAKVTVNPLDIQKVFDGNKNFEVEYELGGDEVSNLKFDISLDKSSSERVGKYTLKVNADLTSHRHGNNIELTLLRDKVTALILPDLRIELSNKSYPTTITYGDAVPEVKAEYFNVSAEAELSYQWFKAGKYGNADYFPESAIEAPKNAGVYILRVQADSKDGSLISNTLELKFEIKKRSLTVDIYAPADIETEERYGRIYYVFDPGEAFTYEVNGFAFGDTLESLGLKMGISLKPAQYNGMVEGDSSVNPVIPFEYDYCVTYNVPVNDNYEVGKYVVHGGGSTEEDKNCSIYVSVRSPGYIYPVETEFVTDGDPISPNILISVPTTGLAPNGDEFDYTVKVFNPHGIEILEKIGEATTLDKVYLYNHTFTESWNNGHTVTRGAFSAEGDYRVTVEINGAGIEYSYETTFTLQFFNSFEEGVSEIVEHGVYTVKIINENGAEYEAELYAQQKLTMNLKPHEYNISEGRVEYDPTKVITEAGNVIHLNHTLVDVYFNVDVSLGKIYVGGLKVVDNAGNDVSRLYSVEYETSSWPSHNDELNICHIFDNPCDYDCNISGCDYLRGAAHSGGFATCIEKAICDTCGCYYGDYAVDRHVLSDTIVYPDVSSPDESHLLVYVCCGGTKTVVSHTHITPATCTSRAVCSECGWEYGEFDPTNHSSDNRTYAPNGDTHKVTHHCCGAVETENHSGGTAYCNAKPVCSLCDGSYGEINPDNHLEQVQYIPNETDATLHNELYACCGKSTPYTHSGGNATCIAKAICDYCKASYGELDPSDHASESFAYRQDMDNPSLHTVHHACCDLFIEKNYHNGGEANCLSPALCSDCGTPYGEKNYRNHASNEYSFYPDPDNTQQHIKVASCCGEFANKEQHSYGEPTCLHAARCVCGKEIGEPVSHSYDNDCDAICNSCGEQTRAITFHVGKDGKPCEICGEPIPKDPISGGGISAIVTASTVATSAGGFSLFWFVIKKKKWSDLVRILTK